MTLNTIFGPFTPLLCDGLRWHVPYRGSSLALRWHRVIDGHYHGQLSRDQDGGRHGNSRGEGELRSSRMHDWPQEREICVIHQCINPAPLNPRSMAVDCKFTSGAGCHAPDAFSVLIIQTRHRVASPRSKFDVIGLR